ncbi:serine/threonine-protein kinase [Urbifossiella limnaea]|uniref:Serine/threonine-protein kinase PknB n=1 Tax=Urbifossiella limnaea TaxID=2528023 RepID=A0A517XNT2_9BACT|nr:serine/threonine-protein kinase [Urbifossiella limnaea]QDU19158.1 Serine/threonine-protein kinase PknB [Urbifossiella limnaea]
MTDDRTRPSAAPTATDATAVAAPGSTPGADGTIPGGAVAVRTFADYPVVPGYTVTGELGRGGMGWVLTATDLRFGRDVAVKLPLPGLATDHACKLFVHEAVITGRLAHPGIPPAHHLGELPDGTPFLAMKLVRGRTLAALLAERPDPTHDLARFVGVFEQVCQAVGYAHDQGVLHRDLKPGNVMVGAFGEVQVMDWGLAVQRADGEAEPGQGRHPAGGADATEIVGTPAYMAPEQARGERVDARADVFALGGVLASVLVGRAPFWADAPSSTLAQAAAGDTTGVLAVLTSSGADSELVEIAVKCLAPDRAGRPADGTAVARLVAAHRAGVEERLRTAERDRAAAETRAVEQRKRRGVELVLAAAMVVLVAGAGAVGIWRAREVAADDRRTAAAIAEQARLDAEAERRLLAERERTARAATAVADLLDQAEAALKAGAADRARSYHAQAARRAADDALTEPAPRLAAVAGAVALLRDLDAVDDYRWTPLGSRYPSSDLVAKRWAAALAAHGVVPSSSPTAVDAARVAGSPVRTAILAALDGWMGRVPTEPVRALLAAADPDPFRTEVRRLMAAQDAAGLAAVAERPEWTAQPAGLVEAFAAEAGVPVEVRRALLVRVAAARPDDYSVLMELGATYPLDAAAAERARWFQAAAAVRPGSAPARLSLGSALRVAGDADGAVAACREAVRLDPKSAAARNNLGTALAARGEFAPAVAELREAVRLDPTIPQPHQNLGNALMAVRNPAAAAAAYRDSLRLDPSSLTARLGLGAALTESGDAPGALAAFDEVLRADPNNAAAHNGRGNVFGLARQWDRAEAAYREALRLDPGEAQVYGGLGRVLRAKGELAAAAAVFREAIRLAPRAAAHHNGLGLVLEAGYDFAGAERAFREAARLDPRSPLGSANLGQVLRKQGRTAEAVEAFRAALAVQPENRFARAGLEFCLRVQRGEVPTAPPPR